MLADPSVRLREAIIEGNLLIVKRLLRRFPDYLTNIDPSNGWSSLHYASFHGRYLICVYLIQLGHDKHELMTTFKGNTCVHLALMNGHEQTTHLLLQYFPQFIDKPGEHGRTPAHIACMHDYFQCLSLLIGVGAKMSTPDDDGDTPLHVCLEYGSIDCMRILVVDGGITDDNIKNHYNWKPSDVALTFEIGKIYTKLSKEAQMPGLPRKPSYNSFRTPVLPSKPAFDDGPSPVLTMNSPYSLYSQAAPMPSLPRISTSRRPSAVLSTKSPIGNSSFQSRFASKDSSLNNSSTSLQKRDTSSSLIDSQQTRCSSDISPKKKEGSAIAVTRNADVPPVANAESSNSESINKYLTGHGEGREIMSANGLQDETIKETKPRHQPRRRISLLNIPVAKLRNNDGHKSLG